MGKIWDFKGLRQKTYCLICILRMRVELPEGVSFGTLLSTKQERVWKGGRMFSYQGVGRHTYCNRFGKFTHSFFVFVQNPKLGGSRVKRLMRVFVGEPRRREKGALGEVGFSFNMQREMRIWGGNWLLESSPNFSFKLYFN